MDNELELHATILARALLKSLYTPQPNAQQQPRATRKRSADRTLKPRAYFGCADAKMEDTTEDIANNATLNRHLLAGACNGAHSGVGKGLGVLS